MRLRSSSSSSRRSSVPAPSTCSPKVSAAATASTAPPKRCAVTSSMTLPYIAAPSVATVTIAWSGPSRRCFAVLIAARMLHRLDSPNAGSASRIASGTPRRARRYSRPAARGEDGLEVVGGAVGDVDDEVGVHDVVDERHVLVADALDVVVAEPVAQQRRALERLGDDDARAVALLEEVAGAQRAGRAARRDVRRQAAGRAATRARTRTRRPARGRCTASARGGWRTRRTG